MYVRMCVKSTGQPQVHSSRGNLLFEIGSLWSEVCQLEEVSGLTGPRNIPVSIQLIPNPSCRITGMCYNVKLFLLCAFRRSELQS